MTPLLKVKERIVGPSGIYNIQHVRHTKTGGTVQ